MEGRATYRFGDEDSYSQGVVLDMHERPHETAVTGHESVPESMDFNRHYARYSALTVREVYNTQGYECEFGGSTQDSVPDKHVQSHTSLNSEDHSSTPVSGAWSRPPVMNTRRGPSSTQGSVQSGGHKKTQISLDLDRVLAGQGFLPGGIPLRDKHSESGSTLQGGVRSTNGSLRQHSGAPKMPDSLRDDRPYAQPSGAPSTSGSLRDDQPYAQPSGAPSTSGSLRDDRPYAQPSGAASTSGSVRDERRHIQGSVRSEGYGAGVAKARTGSEVRAVTNASAQREHRAEVRAETDGQKKPVHVEHQRSNISAHREQPAHVVHRTSGDSARRQKHSEKSALVENIRTDVSSHRGHSEVPGHIVHHSSDVSARRQQHSEISAQFGSHQADAPMRREHSEVPDPGANSHTDVSDYRQQRSEVSHAERNRLDAPVREQQTEMHGNHTSHASVRREQTSGMPTRSAKEQRSEAPTHSERVSSHRGHSEVPGHVVHHSSDVSAHMEQHVDARAEYEVEIPVHVTEVHGDVPVDIYMDNKTVHVHHERRVHEEHQKVVEVVSEMVVNKATEHKQPIIDERVVHMPKYVDVPIVEKVQKFLDVQKRIEVEKIVEVPTVHIVDEYEDYPVVKKVERHVEMPQVEKSFAVVDAVEIEQEDEIVEVPRHETIEHTDEELHVRKVQKFVEVPRVEKIQKFVDLPAVDHIVATPKFVYSASEHVGEHIVEVPRLQVMESLVEVPEVRQVTKVLHRNERRVDLPMRDEHMTVVDHESTQRITGTEQIFERSYTKELVRGADLPPIRRQHHVWGAPLNPKAVHPPLPPSYPDMPPTRSAPHSSPRAAGAPQLVPTRCHGHVHPSSHPAGSGPHQVQAQCHGHVHHPPRATAASYGHTSVTPCIPLPGPPQLVPAQRPATPSGTPRMVANHPSPAAAQYTHSPRMPLPRTKAAFHSRPPFSARAAPGPVQYSLPQRQMSIHTPPASARSPAVLYPAYHPPQPIRSVPVSPRAPIFSADRYFPQAMMSPPASARPAPTTAPHSFYANIVDNTGATRPVVIDDVPTVVRPRDPQGGAQWPSLQHLQQILRNLQEQQMSELERAQQRGLNPQQVAQLGAHFQRQERELEQYIQGGANTQEVAGPCVQGAVTCAQQGGAPSQMQQEGEDQYVQGVSMPLVDAHVVPPAGPSEMQLFLGQIQQAHQQQLLEQQLLQEQEIRVLEATHQRLAILQEAQLAQERRAQRDKLRELDDAHDAELRALQESKDTDGEDLASRIRKLGEDHSQHRAALKKVHKERNRYLEHKQLELRSNLEYESFEAPTSTYASMDPSQLPASGYGSFLPQTSTYSSIDPSQTAPSGYGSFVPPPSSWYDSQGPSQTAPSGYGSFVPPPSSWYVSQDPSQSASYGYDGFVPPPRNRYVFNDPSLNATYGYDTVGYPPRYLSPTSAPSERERRRLQHYMRPSHPNTFAERVKEAHKTVPYPYEASSTIFSPGDESDVKGSKPKGKKKSSRRERESSPSTSDKDRSPQFGISRERKAKAARHRREVENWMNQTHEGPGSFLAGVPAFYARPQPVRQLQPTTSMVGNVGGTDRARQAAFASQLGSLNFLQNLFPGQVRQPWQQSPRQSSWVPLARQATPWPHYG